MLHLIDHPLIVDRLTKLRDQRCEPERFRQLVEQVARLMVPILRPGLGDAGDRIFGTI